MTSRLSSTFARLRADGRAGFVAYVMAGDPDLETCWELLRRLPEAGADIVELGFPFSDPMADGPAIQAAGRRALKAKTRLDDALELTRRFREAHPETPLILMGYVNPIHARGYRAFADQAGAAGADGAIVVDLPPEEDRELRQAFEARGLALIRLAAPTTDAGRLQAVVKNASGFVYLISVAGVTGAGAGGAEDVARQVDRIRSNTDLPVVVGFGVRTPAQARTYACDADAVVAGSAIVDALAEGGVEAALNMVAELSGAVRAARLGARK